MIGMISKFVGVVGGVVFTMTLLSILAVASGCTAEAETLAQSVDASGDDEGEELPAATTVARRIEFPAIMITGCVPVNEPGRVTFCENEVDHVVALLATR